MITINGYLISNETELRRALISSVGFPITMRWPAGEMRYKTLKVNNLMEAYNLGSNIMSLLFIPTPSQKCVLTKKIMDSPLIDSLPEEEICGICLNENQKFGYYQTDCNHFFHIDCILKCVEKKFFTCPLCRGNL